VHKIEPLQKRQITPKICQLSFGPLSQEKIGKSKPIQMPISIIRNANNGNHGIPSK
jgi:hypothetical protein